MFNPCISQQPSECTNVKEFCSDECRSIYYKMLWCKNDTSSLSQLIYLNLLCATISDPQYQNSTCIERIFNSSSYGYTGSCIVSIYTNLAVECTENCRRTLMDYKDDCCTINHALVTGTVANLGDEDVISMHTHRLWEHCQVKGPKVCFTPSCPATSPTSTPELAGASKHRLNWFVLLMVVIVIVVQWIII